MELTGFSIKKNINTVIGINKRLEPAVNIQGDVYIQDQTSNIIDYYIPISKEVLELAVVTTIDSYTIELVDATNVIVGDYIIIKKGTRAYQAGVLSINGNVLTMDTPVDFNFDIDAIVESRIINLAVDGSINRVLAEFIPPPNAVVDINVLTLCITDSTDMDDSRFGGIPALTRGIVVRKARNASGYISIFNAKTNGDLSHRMVLEYSDKAPSGFFGLRASKYINGQEGNGVSIRLDGNLDERLQIIIQDDLTGLDSFKMTVRGHIVEN